MFRNPPVNFNDSYWSGIKKSVDQPQKVATPGVAGQPLPGGGCFYKLPNGNTTERQDVNCDGTPTTAALMAADRHGQKVRSLL